MQMQDKLYAHWNEIPFISEERLTRSDGTFRPLSVTNGGIYELMIFLDKVAASEEFGVTIYKAEPGVVFGPNSYDKFSHYELKDEFDIFFFERFEDAREFICVLSNDYPEYQKRPYRRIEKTA